MALILALALPGCAALRAPAPAAQAPAVAGITYQRLGEAGPPARVWHVATLDLARVRLTVTPGDASAGSEFVARTTSAALLASTGMLAVNGGFYAVPPRPPADGSGGGPAGRPMGLDAMGASISGGVQHSGPQQPNTVLDVTLCVSGAQVSLTDGQTCPPGTGEAMTAGPWLVRAGVADVRTRASADFAERRHPRTALGLSRDGRTAWLVVVDGRQPASAGASLAELAARLVALGAWEAMNLDGGGSSAMVIRRADGSAHVLNSPIDGGMAGRERAVANHLIVTESQPGAPRR